MLLQTILSHCHKFSGFKYTEATLDKKTNAFMVTIEGKKSAKAECSICTQSCATYDHQAERQFEFIPLWGFSVKLIYRPRRVTCLNHGVVIEAIPWAIGKRPICRAYALFLSQW